MPLLKPEEISTAGPQGVAEDERPVIYMAGPTPANETELGPIMEKLYERFYNRADFVDPSSIHGEGDGGGGDLVDIDNNRYWNSGGGFKESVFERDRTRRADDSLIIDLIRGDIDEAFGFEGYTERFLDVALNSIDALIEIDPLLFDLNFDADPDIVFAGPIPIPIGIPFFDLEFDPVDINIFGGIVEFVKQMIFQSLATVVDAVLVSRKAGHNMVGAAMEVKEAYDNDLPVAVYDHSDKETSDPIPVMLDQHSDYVTNNPNWAASWLIDEVQKRKENGDVQQIKDSDHQ